MNLFKNKTLAFILINLSLSLLVFVIILSLLFIKANYLKLSYPATNKTIQNYKSSPLVAGEKIKGEIPAKENFLGTVRIKFDMKEKIVKDTIIFRIKEKGNNKWYYQAKYDAQLFTGMQDYPFGFPVIKNSKGKTYAFEIESLHGTPENGVRISTSEPLLTSEYLVPISYILKNPSFILQHFTYPFAWILFLIFLITTVFLYLKNPYHFKKISWVKVIFTFGMILRLILLFSPITFDLTQFVKSLNLLKEGKNIYIEQKFYNYSPLFLYILLPFNLVTNLLSLPDWVSIRLATIASDIAIFFLLIKILRLKGLPYFYSAFFFLNPISWIISAHHTQFNNISMFFLLLGFYYYLKKDKTFKIFSYLTLALTVKHISVFFVLTAFFAFFGIRRGLFLAILSILLFLLSFFPYVLSAKSAIIENAFKYSANPFVYGAGLVLTNLGIRFTIFQTLGNYYRYAFIFIMGALSFVLSRKKPEKAILSSILAFLTFTPGIHSHYLDLPVAFASISPTETFLGYSLGVSLFYLTFYAGLASIGILPISALWIFVSYWFIITILKLKWIKEKQK